ncbi:MAG: protein kinase [Verrucomicrobia bacterium]|nr:protein kinase [Verrucomicrobiota bacterium]
MNLREFLEELADIGVAQRGRGIKPHKYVALLAVLQLVRDGKITKASISFNEDFKRAFRKILDEYGGKGDRNRPHAPFFHLGNSSFWRLVATEGKEQELAKTKTVGSPGDLNQLVSHALLDESVFHMMKNPAEAAAIEDELVRLILLCKKAKHDSQSQVQEEYAKYSLYQHEERALKELGTRIKDNRLGIVLTNFEIHDPQSNRYFETDAVVVSEFGIYVLELKHWSGLIEVKPNSWIQNHSFYKPDPHKVNNRKAKLLKGLFERKFPHFPSVWFESAVVLTNPNADVEGATTPQTKAHNPTFARVDHFIDYLKHQRKQNGSTLSDHHCDQFVIFLRKLQAPSRPRDFEFPGYEIVKRLYQHTDRAEVIARRTDVRYKRLSRLRIFFPPATDDRDEKRQFHEKATATLNAVAKIGDHPNIIKVWSVPNENNFIVEGSDWSETGSLRDVLQQESPLRWEKTRDLTAGILAGLSALHRGLVIHRALSPENVLLVGSIPKLMNFDLSFQLEDDRTTVIPDASQLKRTPYMAPEIYKGGVTPEASADIFSVGVLMYEMLTGEKPFGCSTELEGIGGELADRHLARLKEKNVTEEVQDLIVQMVQAEPSKRPASVGEVLAAMHEEPAVTSSVSPNAKLEPGDRHALYEIWGFLEKGAQSQIYHALGPQAKHVVLKLFNLDVELPRVLNEYRAAGVVNHPSLVTVENYGSWSDDRLFISFDWSSDKSLRDEIDNAERPDFERFKRMAEYLLDAVQALHTAMDDDVQRPLVHNDIKPENVLLTDRDRPVLIDFGSALRLEGPGIPKIQIYEGTTGYVAPDLHLGEDRQYCEDGDLYALGVTLYEWLYGVRPSAEIDVQLSADFPEGLPGWFNKATAPKSENRFGAANEMLNALNELTVEEGGAKTKEAADIEPAVEEEAPAPIPQVEPLPPEGVHPNPFVAYLNSLHSRSAASENALAEAQARSSYFGRIHVPHPLTKTISEILCGKKRRHVILTGHAGDGKSTIGLELYKQLLGLPPESPIDHEIEPRTDVSGPEKKLLSIIKDFSEWHRDERQSLIEEAIEDNDRRFLFITNTGTLLDAFKFNERNLGGDELTLESELLERMDSATPKEWEYRDTHFTVINLSLMDNLCLAREIFTRMVKNELWDACVDRDCQQSCPIYRNVCLIRDNFETVIERLFMAYRRMYEYGTRLTLRQFSAHLAYMITSGLNYKDISKMAKKASRPLITEFMFFNRFFGDNGRVDDGAALQLRGINAARSQDFGVRTAPVWERHLWLSSRQGDDFEINAIGCLDEYGTLRHCGVKVANSFDLSPSDARRQVRRMMFFLNRFDEGDTVFVRTFLNSNMAVDFSKWQAPEFRLSLNESNLLRRRILHVIQEHFTGVRLPEGQRVDELFITLCRHSHEIRQSAQVVLARVAEDDLSLRLVPRPDGTGRLRRQLVLQGRNKLEGLNLQLELPFLDYVMSRNQGEIGECLDACFTDRLERFKGQILARCGTGTDHNLMLVRLKTSHEFKRQMIAVGGDRLEVTDA